FHDTTNYAGTIMDNCIVEYGGHSSISNIYFYKCNPRVRNSIIRYCATYAVRIESCSPTVSGNTITDNNSRGIYINWGAPTIQGNTVTNSGGYGLYVSNGTPTISGNVFSGNGNYDLYYYGTTGGTITGNTINQGIYLRLIGVSEITSNTINQNNSYPIRVGPSLIEELSSDNTINNINTNSYLNVLGGTIIKDTTFGLFETYAVLGTITVQGTDGGDGITTLTIQPGVEVRFGSGCQLTIGASTGDPGALMANAGSGDEIKFTANSSTPTRGFWKGIYFHDTTNYAGTIMDNCIVEYGGHSSISNIYFYKCNPRVRNSIIRYCAT
ncbi:MAG: right-handed parallel beta-helix repeat-containing protein, partial [Planctomycetes bacterium]|nr:right-handed parallel beta-helix repeat-containing protein [Planctomycetota bacterium]